MMLDVFRLDSVSPQLAELFRRATPSQRRQGALNACVVAVSKVGLDGDDVKLALDLLRRGGPVVASLRERLESLVSDLDDQYLRLSDEDGEIAKAKAVHMFSKARAAAALVFALTEDSNQLHEAVYEAITALKDPTELVLSVEKVLR